MPAEKAPIEVSEGVQDDAAKGPRIRVVKTQERELLLRHREGDPDAFAVLVEEYRAPVYSYLIRCGVEPEDRDDLFQEIFLRVHRAASSYEAHRPVHPWIFTIVSNTIRTHLRQRRVRELVTAPSLDATAPNELLIHEAVDESPDSERLIAARETLSLVEREIHRLSVVQREVVLLVAVERMAQKDAAKILGMPVNTVKTHLRRARLALAAGLVRENAGRTA
jgi:RNA polymerase sigma-70 factor (ECF subfamily)